jgi:hypothetical protein
MYLGNYTIKDNIITFPWSNMQLLSEIENIPYKHILIVYYKYVRVLVLHESCDVVKFDTCTIEFSNYKYALLTIPYNYDNIIKTWKDIEILESLFEINIQENIIEAGKLRILINYESNTFTFMIGFILYSEFNIDKLIDYIRLNFPEYIKPPMIKSII